ncbi:caspase family protein [Streptomyces odontomachi]|uniref:caspase family protein n=1 Tax=Streptomyces odontomachi TaxID=2944940 RepID=UPI00210E34A7|nr:caspase family protein [Streptomyces sp. ODS25]
MAVLSDPAGSEAVLVGVHDYTHLADLPAVARNLQGLRRALTDPAVWGLPAEACTVISQPGSAGQVLDPIRDRARRTTDTLLVYYSGHGLTDPYTDELYLALPDSDREREYTSLRYEYLRRAVLDVRARARRTVVVLDCCYSGRALLGRMSASAQIADQAIVEGTCLLTASAETRPALSPPGETYTAFTGELIAALTEGIPNEPDPIDMDTLYRHLHTRLAGRSRPLPQQRNRNTGGLIAIARNRAVTPRDSAPGAGRVRSPSSDTDFAPFWFAVPVPRRLVSRDDASTPVGELLPGTWYLAAEQEGDALVVFREGQCEGLLLRTDRIQRADDGLNATVVPDFAPFWLAVPVPRRLVSRDDASIPAGELLPGTWYLAVGQEGDALVVVGEGDRKGLLMDTAGIQRG